MARGSRIVDAGNIVQDVDDFFIAYNDEIKQVGQAFIAEAGVIRQFWPKTAREFTNEPQIVMDETAVESYDSDTTTAKAICNYDCRTGEVVISSASGEVRIPAISPPTRGQGNFLYKFEVLSGSITEYTFAGGAPSSTLVNDLEHWWTLDEESGNRADSVGSITLTDNNTVTFIAGTKSNAADFTATNSEYLSNTAFGWDVSVDWSVGGRFKVNSVGGTDRFTILMFGPGDTLEPDLYLDTFGTDLRCFCYTTSYEGGNVTTVAADTWYNYVITFDASDGAFGTIRVYIDDTLELTIVLTGTLGTTANTLRIGRNNDGTNRYLDGAADEFAFWSRILTASEITEHHGAGSGVTYSDITASGPWHDVLEEGTVAIYENYLENAGSGVLTGQAIISFAEDDGAGAPLAGTIVNKVVNFTSEIIGSSITMSATPWTLSNTEVNENAEVFLLTIPAGWWDPENEVTVEDALINGEFGFPKGVQFSEIYAPNWDATITVKVDVISGAVQGDSTGVALSTDERRIWYIETPNPLDTASAVVDVTITDGVESVTKRVTMYAEQQQQAATSALSDEFTRLDEWSDWRVETLRYLGAGVDITVDNDGYLYAIGIPPFRCRFF